VSFPAPVRFALEAALLVAVALAMVATDLELLPFVLVMGAAWILVATAERMLSGAQVALPAVRRQGAEHRSEALPARRARDVEPEAIAAAEPAPEREAAEAQPEPDVEAEPEPEPERRASLEAVPTPEPEPEPEPQPESAEHEDEPVVELPQTAHRRPDGWNLWDLEQRAHERAGQDPFRDEEWNALFVSLRDYARPDGTLPHQFDQLVQESFAELISRRS
jgi:hypothetical protein